MRLLKVWKGFSVTVSVFVGILCVLLLVLTQTDFLGDVVFDKISTVVGRELSADIKISEISGNPVYGFKISDIAIERHGRVLASADELEVSLSLPGILRKSPRISTLSVTGLKSDYKSIKSLIPEKKSDKPTDIPIDRVKLASCCLSSDFGNVMLNSGTVNIENSHWYDISIKGNTLSSDFFVKGICKKEKGSWILDGTDFGVKDGTGQIKGAVYPSPDVVLSINNIDISTPLSLSPKTKNYDACGSLSGKFTLNGAWSDICVNGEAVLKDSLISGVPFSEVAAKIERTKGLTRLEISEGRVFKSPLSGLFVYDTRKSEPNLEVLLSAENLCFTNWTEKFGKDMPKDALFLSGTVTSLDVDLKGPISALVGSAAIASSDIGYKNFRFAKLSGSAKFDGKKSGVVDFSALYNGRRVTLTGKLGFAEGSVTNLKLLSQAVSLEDFWDMAPFLKQQEIKGSTNAAIALEGLGGNKVLNIAASSPSVSMKKAGNFRNVSLTSSYRIKERLFDLKKASAELNGASIAVFGKLAQVSSGDSVLDFNSELKNADAKRFYGLLPFLSKIEVDANFNAVCKISGNLNSPLITASFGANDGYFRNIKIDKFKSDMSYTQDKVVLPNMQISSYGGKALLGCSVDIPKTLPNGSKSSTMWDVSGTLDSVGMDMLNGLFKSNEDISGSLSAAVKVFDSGEGLKFDVKISESAPKWKGFSFDDVKGRVYGTLGQINLENLNVKFLRGDSILDGNIRLPEKGSAKDDTALDIKVVSKKINMYELFRKYIPAVRGVQGSIGTVCSVSGTLGSPVFNGTGTLSPLRYRSFFLPVVDVAFNGNLNEFNVTKAEARIKGGNISAKGRMYLKNNVWCSNLDVLGRAVELNQFAAYLPDNFKEGLGGSANFNLSGSGTGDSFNAKGNFESKDMRFLRMNLKNINAPFFVADGYAFMEDVKANMNGGMLTGGVAFDLGKSLWGGSLKAVSVDIESTLRQAMPGLKGKITGAGDLMIRGEGETGRLSTVNGSGVLMLRDGELSEFDAVEAARKYTRGQSLRFAKVKAIFTFSGGDLIIIPGSQAVAPKDDAVYKYVMLDGMINRKKQMSMFAMGKVNIRALNALLGAMQGIINAGMDFATLGTIDKSELLSSFLGGIFSGYSKDDFRFVTMNIGGSTDSPSFYNIEVDKQVKDSRTKEIIPRSGSDPIEGNLLERAKILRLNFEIPLGFGADKDKNGVGTQVLEQTFRNLLRNINFGL